MSQTSSRKQRRRPQRLSWPVPLSQESSISVNDERQTTKQRHIGASGTNNKNGRKRARQSNDRSTTEMWIEKFAPKSSSELSVAPKKVKEIKSWIQNATISLTATPHHARQKLLVLVGSPGIGKSTAVRMIANEFKLSTLLWNESFNPRGFRDGTSRGLFSVEQTSALDSFDEFLQRSGSGIASLNLTSSENNNATNNNSLILLEDLPNLHGASAEARFRDMMSRHLYRSHVPTILIFSDVSEGKHRPEDLERLIDPDILYQNEISTILQIHPVTKPKMKKILTEIAKREGCQFSTDFLNEIHDQSNGDIRHAIMTLQLHATGRARNYFGAVDIDTRGQNQRDTKLSTFHSLGKLLYAKRVSSSDGKSRLAFDPEAILEQSDIGVEGSLRFLEYHSVNFFTDITELSNAFSSFSDAADMLGHATNKRRNSHENNSIFPYACASSIAGRTVANTNIHPAPTRFRQFSRPRVFDILRNRKENQILVNQLSRRISTTGCHSSLTAKFVTESLPYVRQITPHDVDPYLDNLYSVAMQRHRERTNLKSENAADVEALEFQKAQEALLEMDDIEEYDSD